MSQPADPYEIALAPPARRAIENKLPPDVATAAVDFITGLLLVSPQEYWDSWRLLFPGLSTRARHIDWAPRRPEARGVGYRGRGYGSHRGRGICERTVGVRPSADGFEAEHPCR